MANGQLILGAGVIAFITEFIMKITPERINRRKCAAVSNMLIALTLSLLESTLKSHISIWDALLRGFILAMSSAGMYDATKIYGGEVVKKAKGEG